MVVEQHKTIIITTHYIEEANLANRVSLYIVVSFLYLCTSTYILYYVFNLKYKVWDIKSD